MHSCTAKADDARCRVSNALCTSALYDRVLIDSLVPTLIVLDIFLVREICQIYAILKQGDSVERIPSKKIGISTRPGSAPVMSCLNAEPRKSSKSSNWNTYKKKQT